MEVGGLGGWGMGVWVTGGMGDWGVGLWGAGGWGAEV